MKQLWVNFGNLFENFRHVHDWSHSGVKARRPDPKQTLHAMHCMQNCRTVYTQKEQIFYDWSWEKTLSIWKYMKIVVYIWSSDVYDTWFILHSQILWSWYQCLAFIVQGSPCICIFIQILSISHMDHGLTSSLGAQASSPSVQMTLVTCNMSKRQTSQILRSVPSGLWRFVLKCFFDHFKWKTSWKPMVISITQRGTSMGKSLSLSRSAIEKPRAEAFAFQWWLQKINSPILKGLQKIRKSLKHQIFNTQVLF